MILLAFLTLSSIILSWLVFFFPKKWLLGTSLVATTVLYLYALSFLYRSISIIDSNFDLIMRTLSNMGII